MKSQRLPGRVTVNPKPPALEKNWLFENPIPSTLNPQHNLRGKSGDITSKDCTPICAGYDSWRKVVGRGLDCKMLQNFFQLQWQDSSNCTHKDSLFHWLEPVPGSTSTAQQHLQICCSSLASVQEQSSAADAINKIGALDTGISFLRLQKEDQDQCHHKHHHLLMQWANIVSTGGVKLHSRHMISVTHFCTLC